MTSIPPIMESEVVHGATTVREFQPGEPTTLVEVFELVARDHKRPDTLNYKSGGSWLSISSDELLNTAREIAAGLTSLGLSRGDRLAILSESRPEWTLIDAGCLFAGVIDVPIYPTLMPSQVRYILKDSGARVLAISNREKFLQVKEVLEECEELEQVILLDSSDAGETPGLTLEQLRDRGRAFIAESPEIVSELSAGTHPQDLATILYTSGTTGEPKGVMLTHANLVSNLIDSSSHLSFDKDDTALSVLPLSHIFERQAMYMYLYQGMAVYFAESLDTIGPNLREVQPTILVGVPRIFEKIYARIKERVAEKGKVNMALLLWAVGVAKEYAHCQVEKKPVGAWLAVKHRIAIDLVFSKWRAAFGGRIRLLVSGGAALPEELGYIYLGAGIPIIQGYGLTETSPVITTGILDNNRVGTVGKPIKHVEVRIAPDGEIETRGPNVMRGYYKKPIETRAVFTSDGWFRTGDIGKIDADGFLSITDRKKELFKTSGGKYIAPQPLEQLIKGSRFVNQVVLIGNGRRFPSALIVPNWEQIESYARLKGLKETSRADFCRNPRIIDLLERQITELTPDLAQYERVKKVALLEHEFTIDGGELTPTLKVKRRVIDEKYRSLIDELYRDEQG
ncbi:MAG TPA: long-chain fatty acid--CoA ligase [Pyrinomonadaceae bacterium]|nr:long-chain fatty acid--CoA ligase [Pyrinomonadaceae bacterium]